MKFHAIEGNTQKLDGGAMFGNAPREMWKNWIAPDEKNRIPLACRSLHLETDDGRHVLFDVGVGAFFEPKYRERYGVVEEQHMLLSNLQKIGLTHEDIDIIVLSHLHFDHAGGVLSAYQEGKEPELLFPNAKIFVGRDHFERAKAPRMRERASFIPKIQDLLEESGRLALVAGEEVAELDFGLRFTIANGHTIGSLTSWIELDDGPVIFAADLIPGMPWVHLPISMGYDRFPELVVEEKQAVLEELLERNGKIFFTHDPSTPCAKVCRNEKGRYYGEPLDVESLSTVIA